MKATRNFLMLILCMAVTGISMTSCLSSDDNTTTVNVLTPAQKTAMMTNMSGFYEGYVYYINDTLKIDSVAVHGSISAPDSTFTIENFPYRVLCPGITNDSYRSILKQAGESSFTDVLSLYYNEYNVDNYYTFYALPKSENELKKTFTTEDGEHTVKVIYASRINSTNSYGQSTLYYPLGEFFENEVIVYILVYGVEIDGMQTTVNRVLYFYGKK